MACDSLEQIVRRLGGQLSAGGRRASVPGPGHSRRDRSLSLMLNDDGRVVWHSFAEDSPQAVFAYLGIARGSRKPPPAWDAGRRERLAREAQLTARHRDFCRWVWSEARPAGWSVARVYLSQKRCLAAPWPQVLRFHPRAPLDYLGRAHAPALLALVQAADGETIGLHLTALKPDGSDKAGPNARRMFGQVAGGAVRLADPAADGTLAVAEGIETALAFAQIHAIPTWAALSAGGLARFTPPPGVTRLAIAADRDDNGAGMQAAHALQQRLAHRCAIALVPAPSGLDWADVVERTPKSGRHFSDQDARPNQSLEARRPSAPFPLEGGKAGYGGGAEVGSTLPAPIGGAPKLDEQRPVDPQHHPHPNPSPLKGEGL